MIASSILKCSRAVESPECCCYREEESINLQSAISNDDGDDDDDDDDDHDDADSCGKSGKFTC